MEVKMERMTQEILATSVLKELLPHVHHDMILFFLCLLCKHKLIYRHLKCLISNQNVCAIVF